MPSPLQLPEIRRELLAGAPVFARGNEPAGCVDDVIGQGAGAVILVRLGQMLCLGAETVALPAALLSFQREDSGAITVVSDHSRQELELLGAAR